jgi:rhodanese-related sulfurtransferase
MHASIPRTELVRLALTVCLALSAAACADHIGRAELLEQIDAGTAPPIVDVRSRGEYETSHIPGAVHIPFYSMLSRTDQIPEPREAEQPVVVYCEHGPRAGLARAQLWFASDRPVLFLEGHMTAWKRDGLPVAAAEHFEEQASPD